MTPGGALFVTILTGAIGGLALATFVLAISLLRRVERLETQQHRLGTP